MTDNRRSPTDWVEGAHACIDISLRLAEQLFDGRDPAPFRERDLDEDAADYILAAAQRRQAYFTTGTTTASMTCTMPFDPRTDAMIFAPSI